MSVKPTIKEKITEKVLNLHRKLFRGGEFGYVRCNLNPKELCDMCRKCEVQNG